MQKLPYALVIWDISGTLAEPLSDKMPPELYTFMQKLHEKGVKQALATNLSARGTQAFIDDTGIAALLDNVQHAGNAFMKPHPEMAHQAMLESGCTPHETLMIGDSEGDLRMAHAAGIAFAYAAWFMQPHMEILGLHPEYCFKDVSQAMSLLLP